MARAPAEPAPLTYLFNYIHPRLLRVTSTTGGVHVHDSYHYSARALDCVGSRPAMRALMNDVRRHPHDFREAFHDPMGWYVKNGDVIVGAIGGHQDHVHLAR